MNASEQAMGLDFTSKIAAIVNLFKIEFPDAKADLKPWQNDPNTREFSDPDSLDIGFHFPGWSRRCQCRSMLVQVRFYTDTVETKRKLIGIDTTGFNHQGIAWRLSTVEKWQIEGNYQPTQEVEDRLKNFCRQVFQLFN